MIATRRSTSLGQYCSYRKSMVISKPPKEWVSDKDKFFNTEMLNQFIEWFDSELVQGEIASRLKHSEEYDTACFVVYEESGEETRYFHPGIVELFKNYMYDQREDVNIFGTVGYIYGVSYDNGMVKIGRSARGYNQRLGTHDFSMKIMGAKRVDHFVTRKVRGYKDVETKLIHCMNELFQPTTHEWYRCDDLTKVKQIVKELIKDR